MTLQSNNNGYLHFSSSCTLPCYFIVYMDIFQVQVDKPTDFAYIRCNNVNWL